MSDSASSSSATTSAAPAEGSRVHDRARMHFNTLDESHGSSEHFSDLKPSILRPFFGSNIPESVSPLAAKKGEHPCAGYARQVHQCLDSQHNDFTFCQSAVFVFNQCLNELGVS